MQNKARLELADYEAVSERGLLVSVLLLLCWHTGTENSLLFILTVKTIGSLRTVVIRKLNFKPNY